VLGEPRTGNFLDSTYVLDGKASTQGEWEKEGETLGGNCPGRVRRVFLETESFSRGVAKKRKSSTNRYRARDLQEGVGKGIGGSLSPCKDPLMALSPQDIPCLKDKKKG